MGWMEVDEELMSPKIIGETVNSCITTLSEQRKDLYNTDETWANVCCVFFIFHFYDIPSKQS